MRWFAGVAIVSLVGVLPFAGSAEAQVDGPTLTVNPSTDIDWRGESVQISVSDRAPGTKAAVGLCRADVPIPPASLTDLTSSCGLIAYEITADPYEVTLPIGLSGAQHCVEVGCVIGYIGYTGTIFPQPLNLTYVESAMVPISFTEVDEVPPTHPDFAMTVTPTAGLVHGQSVQVQVVNRNPVTTRGSIRQCREGVDYATALSRDCRTLWKSTAAGNVEASVTVSRNVDSRDDTDCVFEECVLVYVGVGSTLQPMTELVVQPLDFAEQPPLFTASPTTDLVVGDTIDVAWNAWREVPASSDSVTIVSVSNYVGICLGDAGFGREFDYSAYECEGIDLGATATSGATQITAKRFIETDRFGTVDCMAYQYGCRVGHSLNYIANHDGGSDIVVLHQLGEPLSFRREFTINAGAPTAAAGSSVPVSVVGARTVDGAGAFVMACGFSAGWTLQCDDEVGTIDGDFDGDFTGSITMPAVVNGATADVDCRAQPCLIVFLVVDPTFAIIDGSALALRATEAAR